MILGPEVAAVGDEELADLSAAGADPELLDVLRDAADEEDAVFEVHDDCWDAMLAFLAINTQVRTDQGVAIGFDYQGVRAGLGMAGIDVTPSLFADLQIIERAAVEAWRELAEAETRKWRDRSNSP